MAIPSANAFTEEIKNIENTIESHVGTRVLWSWGDRLCSNKDMLLFGYYSPSEDVVVMCQKNHKDDYLELVSTLKHEGWHAVQEKCNQGKAALSQKQLRPYLSSETKHTLQTYYPIFQSYGEAEARVVEQIPTRAWIRGVQKYCAHLK